MKIGVILTKPFEKNMCDKLLRNQTYKNYVILGYGNNIKEINELILKSDCELFYFYDSNTQLNKELFKESVKIHEENKEAGITYTFYTENDELIKSTKTSSYKEAIDEYYENDYINFQTCVIKKECFYTIGLFNDAFKHLKERDLLFRILGRFKTLLIEKPLVNITKKNKIKCDREEEIIRERYKLQYEKGRGKVCAMLCVKNEREIINQCVNDLSMYVDYICVFDDGSTDETPELLRKWKKIEYVLQKKEVPKRTEGKDRQKLLDISYYTSCDFFLFIDADEVFEEAYKTEIFKEMKREDVNLWFYHEINFWRSEVNYRVDYYFDIGWFGRLFRRFPNLILNNDDLHPCSIPKNIPNTSPWYNVDDPLKTKKSVVRVKHYGFSTEERILKKFNLYWNSDDRSLATRYVDYSRLVDEESLEVKRYDEIVYCSHEEKEDDDVIIKGDEYGRSEALKDAFFKIRYAREKKEEVIVSDELKNNSPITNNHYNDKSYAEDNILVIGQGNCFRTQYIQFLFTKAGFAVRSCGLTPVTTVHEEVVKLLKEFGMSGQDFTKPQMYTPELLQWATRVISLVDVEIKEKKKIEHLAIPDGTVKDVNDLRKSICKIQEVLKI